MTRHEELLAAVLTAQLRDATPEQAAAHLLRRGLVNVRACEQVAVRAEVGRLYHEGVPRCEAMHAAAETFCCSYEKVRGIFYNSFKS